MSKLVSLILVVVLLLGVAAPAWAGYSPSVDNTDGKKLVNLQLIRPMGGCEDGGASNCDYG